MPNTPRFRWDARSARYRGARGRFVSPRTVRKWVDDAIVKGRGTIRALTESLRLGQLSPAQWELAMRTELRAAHLAAAMAAQGGRAEMTPAAWGRAGQQLREQYQFLRARTDAIVNGSQPLDGSLAVRALLYIEKIRGTYAETRRRVMERLGFDEERNLLTPAEHCEGPGSCLEQTALGWVPVGSLVPLTERLCMANDRCEIIYRNSQTGEVAA